MFITFFVIQIIILLFGNDNYSLVDTLFPSPLSDWSYTVWSSASVILLLYYLLLYIEVQEIEEDI